MEEYENMEKDAPDASATTTTPGGQEHEASSQTGQVVQWIGVELGRNEMGNVHVLRATNGNATKRLKLCVTTRAGKSAYAVLKQFVTKELQAKK